MTEAGWTSEKPSKEGVYWFRWTENSNPLILSVAKDDCDWRVLEMGNQYDGALAGYSGGEFLGPITPDSYQHGRVAGLREAANEMCYLIAQYGAGAHAINLFGEWLKEQTRPQPAQDEKGGEDGKDSV